MIHFKEFKHFDSLKIDEKQKRDYKMVYYTINPYLEEIIQNPERLNLHLI